MRCGSGRIEGRVDLLAVLALVGFAVLRVPVVSAQMAGTPKVALDLRGGFNVPTFTIADIAKAGPSVGVGLNFNLAERVWLIGDADFGFHSGGDLPGGGEGPDLKVNHYMLKIGYQVLDRADSRLALMLNAGAGVMTFAADGGRAFTYPGINVGAKLTYRLGNRVSLLLSPQGDIAFTKKAEVGTTNAWVWPFSAGLRVMF